MLYLPTEKFQRTGKYQKARQCQYPGCTADLLCMRDFNMRCKICEFHYRASSVELAGEQQRFCQQCNKFHPLASFDQNKRSCREKLLQHNLRRRTYRNQSGSLPQSLRRRKYFREGRQPSSPYSVAQRGKCIERSVGLVFVPTF
uniref:Squamosa promoter-binding (Sbp domain) transcription factor family protein n=1 Tax=Tetraselmis sp. GSL018 TaxID=582737 RepID=A0A061RPB4_9CHLO